MLRALYHVVQYALQHIITEIQNGCRSGEREEKGRKGATPPGSYLYPLI